jgi:hypothetical protein
MDNSFASGTYPCVRHNADVEVSGGSRDVSACVGGTPVSVRWMPAPETG